MLPSATAIYMEGGVVHTVHLIAVVADDADEAIGTAETAIEGYGDGQVWDWHEAGGRWSDFFGEDHGPALNFLEDPQLFQDSLLKVLEYRNQTFRELIRSFSGTAVTTEEEAGNTFGFPIDDLNGYLERVNANNAKEHAAWQKLLTCHTLEEFDAWTRAEKNWGGMVGYRMQKLGQLVGGYYNFDSHFYDAESYGCDTSSLIERLEKEPANQWLVVMDLHN